MKCQSCSSANFNCYGGKKLTPKSGFWRKSKESTIFFKCPLELSCLGENRTIRFTDNYYFEEIATGICKKGYHGLVCKECDEGYGESSNLECSKCDSIPAIEIVKMVLGMLIRVILALNSINSGLKSSSSFACKIENFENNKNSGLIKIFTIDYLQILGVILLFPLFQDFSFFNIFSAFSDASTQDVNQLLSFRCLFISMGINLNIPYIKLIFVWIYFLTLFLLASICFNISFSKKKKLTQKEVIKIITFRPDKLTKMLAILVVVLFISLPIFLKQTLALFTCINFIDNISSFSVMATDYTIRCYEKSHLNWILSLGLISLIFIVIIFPGILFYKLLSIKRKFTNKSESKQIFIYGYLFNLYKEKYHMWDLIILMRRFLINLTIALFFNQIKSLQIEPLIIIFIILILGYFMNVNCKPFKNAYEILNTFSEHCFFVLISTYFLIMAYFASKCFRNLIFVKIIYLSIAILLNAFIFIEFTYLYIKSAKRKYIKEKKTPKIKINVLRANNDYSQTCLICSQLKKENLLLKRKNKFLTNLFSLNLVKIDKLTKKLKRIKKYKNQIKKIELEESTESYKFNENTEIDEQTEIKKLRVGFEDYKNSCLQKSYKISLSEIDSNLDLRINVALTKKFNKLNINPIHNDEIIKISLKLENKFENGDIVEDMKISISENTSFFFFFEQ